MLRPLISLIAASALLGSADDPTVEEARKAMRPSLVVVCQRTVEHMGKKDWLRVRLTLTTVRPMAAALDRRWKVHLAPDLESAVTEEDGQATLNSLLAIVYWDTRDLLTPLLAEDAYEARQTKTQLLKATQNLRYLAPVIQAPRKAHKDQKPVDRKLIYARLEKLLVNAVRQLPSSAYGHNPHWHEDIRVATKLFLSAIQEVLPELHGKPDPRKEPQETDKKEDPEPTKKDAEKDSKGGQR